MESRTPNLFKLSERAKAAASGPVARKVIGLSGSTAAGQLTFVIAIPLLSRLFTPADFGMFTIYLSIVNIFGPIVGLKFESGLYAAETRDQARVMLALSTLTMSIIALIAVGVVALLGTRSSGSFEGAISRIGLVLPVGILIAGMWSSTSAWAIKSGAISTLAIARFLQPTAMTTLQLMAGFLHLPGLSLVIAHLLSHSGYAAYILARSLSKDDCKHLFSIPVSRLLIQAREHIKFPLFAMPAQVSTLVGINLPPILIGFMFGMDKAGYCGLAYRVIAAPLTVVSLPLGHVFTSEISRDRSLAHLRQLGARIFLASILTVVIPLLVCGSLAPHVSGRLLGARWAATGEIVYALAVLGAAQAIATPFAEITSIYRVQGLRLITEITSTAFIFAPLALSALGGWSFKSTIWIMSVSGAAGYVFGFALTCTVLIRRLSGLERRHEGMARARTSSFA
ncbi:MAG TPA: oligosaccharide flippase family protein [Methylovirgula sp.]|nr:oligosaccharide flippase family protein [Methylovirgula sp.]